MRDWRGESSGASDERAEEWSARARNPEKPDPSGVRGTPSPLKKLIKNRMHRAIISAVENIINNLSIAIIKF